MVFSSTTFLFGFLPITLMGYYALHDRLKNYWLLLVSLVFFGWSQPNYLWIILLNIAINYTCAMLMDRWERARKPFVFLAVLLNLALLFYFKYFDFTAEALNTLLHTDISLRHVVLPIGISFFTFQGMSYVIDVYRKHVPVQRDPMKLALYIVLFPQLIAGPIVRYVDVEAEISVRRTTWDDFSSGIERFIVGLAKKTLIANSMAVTADAIWGNGATGNLCSVAWIGSLAYMLQIYFDFSGYSDMAIGLGRMFGFHFSENFNLPYISRNISEFWRRWHISLSSWFRDYVYIPLGGNRKRVYLNLSIVFLLTGIWHGASWHYILWGIWNGIFILAERFLKIGGKKADAQPIPVWKNIVSRMYTLLVVNLGWVLFRAPGTREAIRYAAVMFGLLSPENPGYTAMWYLDRWTVFIMLAGIIFSTALPQKCGALLQKHLPEKASLVGKYVLLLLLLLASMLRIVSGTYNPFIYFQF